jgi:hypothetical protein
VTLFAVPNLLQKAITATRSSLESQLQILLERVSVLTAAVESCVGTPSMPERKELYGLQEVEKKAEFEERTEEPKKLSKISRKQMQTVLDGLVTARQLEVYLRCLSYIIKCAHARKLVNFVLLALKYIKQPVITLPIPAHGILSDINYSLQQLTW